MSDRTGTPGPPGDVPDLGFFAGPSATGSEATGFAPAAPSRFGGPPATPFGTAAVPQAVPTSGSIAGLPGWVIAVLCGVGALLLLGIVAAVAVPALRQSGDAAADTSITMPGQVGDLVRVNDPQSAAAAQQLEQAAASDPQIKAKLRQVQGATYQRGAARAAVLGITLTSEMSGEEQQQFLRGFTRGIEAQTGFPVTLNPVLNGSLRGTFGCGQVPVGRTNEVACVATSSASAVIVLVSGASYDEATDIAVTLREGVEHHS
jgi:hypothetical protein